MVYESLPARKWVLDSLTSWARRLARRFLPEGGTLSEERWWKRHRGVLGLLWVHALIVPIYTQIRGLPLLHALGESLVLPTAAVIASIGRLPRRARTLAAAVGLLTASGVLVHLSGGLIEMHFHFFVMVVVVSLYQDWIPFLAAIGYVLVHHGVVGALDPGSVYNHPAAINDPWKWAGIHAFFIAGISVASLVAWRLNETLLVQRRAAEARLRDEVRIVENLNEVGQLIVTDLDLSQVVQRVVDAATERTSAQFGAFFYNVVDEAGESYVLHALSGPPAEAFEGFGMPRNTEVFAPTFAGEGVVRVDDITKDSRYGKMPPHYGMPKGHLPVRSYLAVPVKSRGGVIGGLFFGHRDPACFTETDERIAVGIASQAAVAVENAKLFEAERESRAQAEQSRAEAEQSRRRLGIIAEASKLLSASLDLESVLRNLAELVVPSLADNCVIDFVQPDGTLRRMHLAIEPRAAEAYERLSSPPPDPSDENHPAVQAIKTGKSTLIEEITPEAIAKVVDDGSYHGIVTELNPRSAAIVPIVGREGPLGALTLATTAASGRRLGSDDLALVEELARRAATATENARLYEMQREAAQTLQHSLLPERLPDLPAVEFAARYAPGKAGTEVGGDWYDFVPVHDGSIGLVMGDVVGRGIDAASLMGQIRNALRAYAFDEPDPTLVLERLNALFAASGSGGHMATIVYGVFDIETGELVVASAGHTPPVVRKADGATVVAEHVRGVPLGAVGGARYTSHRLTLEPGDTLLLYTDGLIEDRNMSLDRGLARLRECLCNPIADLESAADRVVSYATADRAVDDDVALLAMRYTPFADHFDVTLPTDPWVLKPFRSALRRWLTEAGADAEEAFQIVVATSEACANVIRHAAAPGVRRFRVNGDRNGEVCIEVSDQGRWRNGNGRRSGGRGLTLIEGFVDHVDITKGPPGTVVSMSRRLMAPLETPV